MCFFKKDLHYKKKENIAKLHKCKVLLLHFQNQCNLCNQMSFPMSLSIESLNAATTTKLTNPICALSQLYMKF